MRRAHFLLRLMPSMTDVAFLMPLVFLFGGMKGAGTLLGDGDTGWHLRTGEWILAHGGVPHRDIFSFTRAGQPWFAWEWLWDVAFGWLHREAGMSAVLVASSVVLALTFALLFRLVRRECGNSLVALAVTLVAAAASTGHWLARPHLFTMLFTVVFYAVLARTAGEDPGAAHAGRWLWLLPPLTALWTNLHGGFVAGVILVAGYAAAEFGVLLRETSAEERRASLARGRRYLAAAAGCGLASFVNPYFYRLHVHILAYLTDGFYRGNIMEFQSLNFQSGQARYFEILLVLGAAAAFVSLRRGRLAWPLLFLVWGHLALTSARHVEIFALLAAPPAAGLLADGLRRAPAMRWAGWLRGGIRELRDWTLEWDVFDRAPRCYLASVAAVLALATVLHTGRAGPGWRAEYDPKSFPVAAAGWLEKAGVDRGVFTVDLWGGYLIYREYPRGRVFMDGRSDFYGPEFAKQYIAAMRVEPGWERYLNRYGVDTVLLPAREPLAGALRLSSTWRSVYDDGIAVIFRPASAPALEFTQAATAPAGGPAGIATAYNKERPL